MDQDNRRADVWHVVAFLLAIFMCTTPFAVYPDLKTEGQAWLGLDPSWQMTLNYALIKKMVWGKDIVYTYGPLGFLGTRIGWGISRWTFLLFDVFVFINFFRMFKTFLVEAGNKYISLLMVIGVALLMNPSHGSDLTWVLTAFCIYWMCRSFKEPKNVHFMFLIISVVICFFLKFNAGFIGILFMIGHLLLLVITKQIKWVKAVVVLVAFFLLLGTGVLFLHVSLPGYIKGALEIVKGYNECMHNYLNSFKALEQDVTTLFYGFLILFVISAALLVKQKQYWQVFFPCVAFAFIFLLRKQAVVRNDTQHFYEFFSYSALILLTGISGFHAITIRKYFQWAGLLIIAVALYFSSYREDQTLTDSIKSRVTAPLNYISGFISYDNGTYASHSDKRYIPSRILQRIGNASIDIFPWDTEYLIENHLNFTPKPVFQSYHAYTPYLGNSNYNYYCAHPPQYILYHSYSIDGRYPFNDDCMINFFIKKNYSCVDSFTSNEMLFLVLERKTVTSPLSMTKLPDTTVGLNDEIPLNGIQMLRIKASYNIAGARESFFYITPIMKYLLTTVEGREYEHKTALCMLQTGMQVDKYILDTKDQFLYLANEVQLPQVKKIKLLADPNFFKPQIIVERYIVN